MQEQNKFDLLLKSTSQELLNPQKQNLNLRKPLKSFRKRKSKNKKQQQILLFSQKKQLSQNPLYLGLQNEDQSRHNEIKIGPWTRSQIQRSLESNSQDFKAVAESKIKFIAGFSQKTFYSKKIQSKKIIADDLRQEFNRKNSTGGKFFMRTLSIRKAILEQEEDISIQLPKIKSSNDLSKFQTLSSKRLIPFSKSVKNLHQKGLKLQIEKLTSYKSSQSLKQNKNKLLNAINLPSQIEKKYNGTFEKLTISLLKAKNIELQNFKGYSKLTSIIHTKKKT